MNVVIIGAGASGLLAGILLAKKGINITILEKEKKIARKLRSTGNGKCNITNISINEYNFHSNTPEFIKDFILSYKEIKNTFLNIGIPFFESDDGRVFPLSQEANAVADKLEYLAYKAGVRIVNECEVLEFDTTKNLTAITTKGKFTGDKFIIATGSKAGRVGGSDAFIDILSHLKHNIYKRYPSLVQLITKEDFSKCSGVKIKSKLLLYSNNEFIKEVKGDLLFTNYGISGLSVLDISVGIAKRLDEYEYLKIKVDFFPDIKDLRAILKSINDDIYVNMILKGILPTKLIPYILRQAGIKTQKKLTNKDINRLNYVLKNYEIEIIDTKGYKSAEVMSGGVDISEIDSNTMQSKKIKNLYLLGEILDIDGDRGGYNLHFCWSSAIKVAKNIQKPK